MLRRVRRRSAMLWLALIASSISAVLPPAALTRTVCCETGRVAIDLGAHSCGAVAAWAACCPCDCDAPDADDDGCCATSPALAPAVQAEDDVVDLGASGAGCLAVVGWSCGELVVPSPVLRAMPRVTGPPDHALARHLAARRSDVLTV